MVVENIAFGASALCSASSGGCFTKIPALHLYPQQYQRLDNLIEESTSMMSSEDQ